MVKSIIFRSVAHIYIPDIYKAPGNWIPSDVSAALICIRKPFYAEEG